MRDSSGKNHRKFRGKMIGVATYSDLTTAYLRERFAPLKHAPKIVARMARVSPRTAENYLAAEHAPSGEALLNLMAHCDDLAALIMAEVQRRKETR